MSEIQITYYGHSCFQLTYLSDSIIFDPYQKDSVPGINLPKGLKAGMVSCSHEHADHNARELIQIENCKSQMSLYTITVDHDDCNGEKRGKSDIAIVEAGDIRIAHFGDLGRDLTEEEYEELRDTDVIMIPVGGYYTIDAKQAKKITDEIQAKLVILMHFRKGDTGYDVISDIEDIKNVFTNLEELNESTICFAENGIPAKVITLTPKQSIVD